MNDLIHIGSHLIALIDKCFDIHISFARDNHTRSINDPFFHSEAYLPITLQLDGIDARIDVLGGEVDVSLVSLLEVDDAPDRLYVL